MIYSEFKAHIDLVTVRRCVKLPKLYVFTEIHSTCPIPFIDRLLCPPEQGQEAVLNSIKADQLFFSLAKELGCDRSYPGPARFHVNAYPMNRTHDGCRKLPAM